MAAGMAAIVIEATWSSAPAGEPWIAGVAILVGTTEVGTLPGITRTTGMAGTVGVALTTGIARAAGIAGTAVVSAVTGTVATPTMKVSIIVVRFGIR
ncbi:hypothetical protein ACW9HQ_47380 [Nocardia gipuzkoensis]